MKTAIHPTYYNETKVTCACGNIFTIGSTLEKLHIELCNKCHPFYTGTQRFVDTASRIQKFQNKQQKAVQFKTKVVKKQEEKKQKQEGPKTLAEMLASLR